MTSMELIELIGDVDDRYVLEIYNDFSPHKKHIPFKRAFLIAALITLLLLLVGCVAVLMKLQDVKIGRFTDTYPNGKGKNIEITSDYISLQGFMGSVNYQAAQEWMEFEKSYLDEKLLKNLSISDYQAPAEYRAYSCYTKEMQEKIDEICVKYELELLGELYLEEHEENLFDILGIHGITSEDSNAKISLEATYYCQDGTFSLNGATKLHEKEKTWPYPIEYQYRCVMKKSFDGVFLTIGNVENYKQWNYTLRDGTEVLLALSENKALMIADKEDYFVTINVLNPSYTNEFHETLQMKKRDMEAFADTFTFDFVPQMPEPAGVNTFE